MALAKLTITCELRDDCSSKIRTESIEYGTPEQISYLLGRLAGSATRGAQTIREAVPAEDQGTRDVCQTMFNEGFQTIPNDMNGRLELRERQQRKDGGSEDQSNTRRI